MLSNKHDNAPCYLFKLGVIGDSIASRYLHKKLPRYCMKQFKIHNSFIKFEIDYLNNVSTSNYAKFDGILLLFDLTQIKSFNTITSIYHQIKENLTSTQKLKLIGMDCNSANSSNSTFIDIDIIKSFVKLCDNNMEYFKNLNQNICKGLDTPLYALGNDLLLRTNEEYFIYVYLKQRSNKYNIYLPKEIENICYLFCGKGSLLINNIRKFKRQRVTRTIIRPIFDYGKEIQSINERYKMSYFPLMENILKSTINFFYGVDDKAKIILRQYGWI